MSTIIVANDKGGVGKDAIAEGIYLAALKAGLLPLLIELETTKRLGELYPEVVYVGAGTSSSEELYRNPDRAFAPLDEAMDRARQAELAIVCLGANLTQAAQVWSETSGKTFFGDGGDLTFAVVLTMSRGALPAGLSNLFELGRLYPACRRVAVLNEIIGEFIDGDKHLADRLTEARGAGQAIETVKVRRMAAPAWGYLQNMGSLPEICAKTTNDLVQFGLPLGPSARSLAMVEKWVADDLIAPLSKLLPPQPPAGPVAKRPKTVKGAE